ncbi:PAS domain-containing protein [Pseudoroseomonas wenyumeiae]
MARFIRMTDWAKTLLGPIEVWPTSLKTIVDMLLASDFPMVVLWRRELIQIYNDRYRDLMGIKHGADLGRPARDSRSEVWLSDASIYDRVWSGETVTLEHIPCAIARTDRLQDARLTLSYSPLRDEAGLIAGMLVVLFDRTAKYLPVEQQEKSESSLLESEARHRLLIESWAQAIWETDANGVVTADSPSWRTYTGQTLDEWIGYGWLKAIHPDDRAYAERQWREAIAARGLVDAEFRLRAPDGGWRWTNVRAAPVLDAEGHVEKWFGMNIDIDARKRAEAALRESEERYRTLFEAMDEAYAVVEVLGDKTGEWHDFRFLEVNSAFMRHTSMPYPVGKTATELLGTPNPAGRSCTGRHSIPENRCGFRNLNRRLGASSTSTSSALIVNATAWRCCSPTSQGGYMPRLRCRKMKRASGPWSQPEFSRCTG